MENAYLLCPKCRFTMVLRDGINGEFYGCSNYPICVGTRRIEEGIGKRIDTPYLGRRKCYKCEQYDDLSPMGFCKYCQEEYEEA